MFSSNGQKTTLMMKALS